MRGLLIVGGALVMLACAGPRSPAERGIPVPVGASQPSRAGQGVDIRPSGAGDHMANAGVYQARGEYGLALVELDQAVAAAPNSTIAENVRTQVRAAATAQVREASRLAAEATRTAAIKLELRPGWSWYQSSRSYVTLEGQLRNISPQSLRSVQAVVIYHTADGTFLTSDSSLIEYRPLLPGQTSPFKVITPYNPAMSTASVEFKELLGGKIEHREAGG